MHTLAKEITEELSLWFRVTNSMYKKKKKKFSIEHFFSKCFLKLLWVLGWVNTEQKNLKLMNTNFIKSFKRSDSSEFALTKNFCVTLGDSLKLRFIEKRLSSYCISTQNSISILVKVFVLEKTWCTLKQASSSLMSLYMVLFVTKKCIVVSR